MDRSEGYTLIETAMVIALSASLFLLTIGLAITASRENFKGNLTQIRTLIQSQYDEVKSGINSRENATYSNCASPSNTEPGNSANCYQIGRAIKFSGEYAVVYYVVANAGSAWPDKGLSDIDNLKSSSASLHFIGRVTYSGSTPSVADNSVLSNGYNANDFNKPQVVSLGGGNSIVSTKNWRGDDGDVHNSRNTIVILRGPVSGSTLVFGGSNIIDDGTSSSNQIKLNDSDNSDFTSKTAFFIKSGSAGYNGGVICVDSNSSSSSSITMNFPINPNESDSSKIRKACDGSY